MNVHLTCETAVANLVTREADIVQSFTQMRPLGMVGRNVWQVDVAVYASSDFSIDLKKSLANYPWVRWATEYA